MKLLMLSEGYDCGGGDKVISDISLHLPDDIETVIAAAVKEADLLICHDCGVMHIGASVGTTTLVLVGRGINPKVWGPYGDGHRCILKSKMADITVDEVFKEALRMLDIKNGKNNYKI